MPGPRNDAPEELFEHRTNLHALQIVSLAHWIVIYLALGHGLGKAPRLINGEALREVGEVLTNSHSALEILTVVWTDNAQLVFTSRILFLVSLGLSKCTIAAFVAQLFTKTNRRAWSLCVAGVAVCGVWTLVAPLVVSVGCHPSTSAGAGVSTTCSSEVCACNRSNRRQD